MLFWLFFFVVRFVKVMRRSRASGGIGRSCLPFFPLPPPHQKIHFLPLPLFPSSPAAAFSQSPTPPCLSLSLFLSSPHSLVPTYYVPCQIVPKLEEAARALSYLDAMTMTMTSKTETKIMDDTCRRPDRISSSLMKMRFVGVDPGDDIELPLKRTGDRRR